MHIPHAFVCIQKINVKCAYGLQRWEGERRFPVSGILPSRKCLAAQHLFCKISFHINPQHAPLQLVILQGPAEEPDDFKITIKLKVCGLFM